MKLKQMMLMNIKNFRRFKIFWSCQVIGEVKDEVKGKIISEFVGLKSKTYSLVTVDNEKIKKAKGANKMLLKT